MSIRIVAWPFAALLLLSYVFPLSAQTPAPTNPPAPGADQSSTSQPSSDQNKDKDKNKDAQGSGPQDKNAGTSNDRLFFTLPNFLTLENGGKVPPLTTGQKFKVVFRGEFDYIEYPWYAALSGISQAENSEPGYGQGWKGYAKRYGAAFADGTIENTMVGAVFPSLLHQDPRFFQSGRGGFFHRTEYAVSRIFVTRTDSGPAQFNYSEIVGSALSAAISTNTYHPRGFVSKSYNPATGMVTYVHTASDRTLPNTASVWGTQVGYDTITIVVKEFWPDIHRKLVHKHKQDGAQPVQSNP